MFKTILSTLALTLTLSSCSDSGVGEQQRDSGPPAAAGDCPWLVSCLDPCAQDDNACVDQCAAQATAAAIAQFNDLGNCLQTYGCTDEACATAKCSAELLACAGTTTTSDGGATPVGGLTTSGKCEVRVELPSMPSQSWCWDFEMTVSGNHNDGTEHFVYYDSESAQSGQTTCSESAGTFTGGAGGTFDAQTISNMNLQNKKNACQAQAAGYGTTATFTEGADCALTGSLGHCTHQVTNVFDASSGTVTATTQTAWSVP